jgi:FSR family fosmidomycin resistance protein-like MFS transporter
MGILAGGYHPTAPPLISASVPPEYLGRALGIHNVGGGSSHFLTPLIAVAIANAWGWRSAFLAMAIPVFLFGIFFYLRLGQINAREKANAGAVKKDAKPTRFRPASWQRIAIFLVLSTVTAATITSIISFVPLLMVDHFHVSKETASVSISVIYGAVFWASPLGGYFADRFGSVRAALAVCFTAGPAIVLFTVLPYGWSIFALLALIGTITFGRMSAAETFIISHTPQGRRSTVLGIYFFSGTEVGGLITPLVGNLIDRFGFTTAFVAAGGWVFTVTLICAFLLREKQVTGATSPPEATTGA